MTPAWGVGDERGDSVSVGVGEVQLRAGVGAFLAQDQPGPDRPCAHVDQVGGLSDPGAVAEAAAGVDRRIPALALVEDLGGIADPDIDGVAEGEPHPGGATRLGEGVGGAGGIAAHQDLGSVRIGGVGPVVAAAVTPSPSPAR